MKDRFRLRYRGRHCRLRLHRLRRLSLNLKFGAFRHSSPVSLPSRGLRATLFQAIDTCSHPAYRFARMKNKVLAAAIVVATLAIAFSLLSSKGMLPLPPLVPTTFRWLVIALIAAIAARRRSLTSWILVGLLAGVEVGHDFPLFAANQIGRAHV